MAGGAASAVGRVAGAGGPLLTLPCRRVVELDRLFPKLRTHPNVQGVQRAYLRSLDRSTAEPPLRRG